MRRDRYLGWFRERINTKALTWLATGHTHELCTRSGAWNRTCLEMSLVLAPEHLGDSPKKRMGGATEQFFADFEDGFRGEKRPPPCGGEREGRTEQREEENNRYHGLSQRAYPCPTGRLSDTVPSEDVYVRPLFFACISTCCLFPCTPCVDQHSHVSTNLSLSTVLK